MRTRWRTLVPYLLALMFAAWGLRGARTCDIVDTDAARHAMNGAFLHDLIRDAEFTRAAEYAKEYYSRLPALSMPYHPPLFPLVESLAFFALGVNVFAARLLVAFAVAATSVLLYNLVLKTHASHLLAFLTTATFLSVNGSQRLASDVMLEFPALAPALTPTVPWAAAGGVSMNKAPTATSTDKLSLVRVRVIVLRSSRCRDACARRVSHRPGPCRRPAGRPRYCTLTTAITGVMM